MEKKYKAFLSYNFENNEKYRQYINSIEPPPAHDKIEFYKKKFYKLNVDNDFNIYYVSQTSSQLLRTSTIVQMILFTLFLLSFYYAFSRKEVYCVIPLSAAFLIGIHKKHGSLIFSKAYWEQILMDDNFHNLLWALIFAMVYRSNFLIWLPLIIRSVTFTAECFNVMGRKGSAIGQVVDYIGAYIVCYKKHLLILKSAVEIGLCIILPVLAFIRGTGHLVTLLYWQIVLAKYLLSENLRSNVDLFINAIDKALGSCWLLFPLKWVFDKLKAMLAWIVNIAVQC
eukprot:TRINITY_DN14326_c0_g1_i6.p1 TRINITY_DN14326_c0_g1~~TRINITY_DN14326_c0_g1_i6.p1  ORF type:complete len:283 (+),score=4.99 TRINITY_DN14326_c0_g1_i6:104-952(+)